MERFSGKRLAETRDELEIPQWRLGVKIGRSQAQISRYEQGVCVPRRSVQRRIAAALGVDLADLMEPMGETGTDVA